MKRWLSHFLMDHFDWERHPCPSRAWCRIADWPLMECVRNHPDCWGPVEGPPLRITVGSPEALHEAIQRMDRGSIV